ncbi:GMP synthase [Seiridium cupressi]
MAQRHNSPTDKLFEGLQDDSLQVWMSHDGKPSQLPNRFITIATTQNSPYTGITHETRHIYGIQFHPEVAHTLRGTELLKNSAVSICGAQQNRKMSKFIGREMIQIRNLVGDRGHIIGAVSGDASEPPVGLEGCQGRRKEAQVYRHTFIDVFEEEAIEIEKAVENIPNTGNVQWFLQGTLYPDVIKAIFFKGHSSTIKTHQSFKDEVRSLGREMKINEGLVMRHPFLGPGIVSRIIGEVTKGDKRQERYMIILHAVATTDSMTAEACDFDIAFLKKVSTRTVNEIDGVSWPHWVWLWLRG